MSKIDELKKECQSIEDNARHTADTHYILAARSRTLAVAFEVVPAVIAAVSGIFVVGQTIPLWWGWLTVLAAVITATSSIISPHKSYYENLNAGKSFTVIKNRARSLHASFASTYTEDEFVKEVRALSDYYNQLVLLTPPTQEWAYQKAEKKIQKERAVSKT